MKAFLRAFFVACPLLVAPACSTLHEILDVPGAVAEDVGGVIPEGEAPAQEAAPAVTPEVIGKAAESGTAIITGNQAIAGLVGAAVAMLAGLFLKKKKATA